MPVQPDEAPFFEIPVSLGDMNRVSKAAFFTLVGDGINIRRIGDVIYLSVSNIVKPFKARVYLVDSSSSSSDGSDGSSSGSCENCDRPMYSFVPQRNVLCGYDTDPKGIVGDGLYIRAFEDNDVVVKNGSIQTLYHHHTEFIPSCNRFIKEYSFSAGGGGGERVRLSVLTGVCLIAGAPPASSSSSASNG